MTDLVRKLSPFMIVLNLEARVSGIPSLHSTTELPNHMSLSLMIYHQIPVPDYIAIHY